MDVLQDTRDRVIALSTEFAELKHRVHKNSVILEELRDLHTAAKASWSVGKSIVSAGRYVATGMTGGGVLWLLQHFPKTGG
jgi:hypothetical protein